MLLIYTYMNLITNTNTLFAKDDCLCLSSLAAKVSNVFSHLSKVQSFYFILKVVIFSLKTLLMLGGADLGERYDSVNSALKGLLFWTEWPISLFDAWCFEFKGFAILRWVLTILEKDWSVHFSQFCPNRPSLSGITYIVIDAWSPFLAQPRCNFQGFRFHLCFEDTRKSVHVGPQ